MPNDVFSLCLYSDGNIVDVLLVVCSQYVSRCYDHYHHHSTCDCCVLQSITQHHEGYTYPTSVGQITLDQCDVALPPQLTLREMVRGSAGLTNMPEQQQLQFQIPSQTYANYDMGPLLLCSSLRVEPPTN